MVFKNFIQQWNNCLLVASKISLRAVNYFVLKLHIAQDYNSYIITLPYAVLSIESPPGITVVSSENDAYQLARSLYVSYFAFVTAFSS